MGGAVRGAGDGDCLQTFGYKVGANRCSKRREGKGEAADAGRRLICSVES
jgi:hypothetical protein